jgi:hypothetical protein
MEGTVIVSALRRFHSMPLPHTRTRLCAVCCWFAIAAATSSVPAQQPMVHPWQQLQMPSEAELKSRWQTPPPEYGPSIYYGMNGPITIEDVRHDLDAMRSLGFRTVTAQYGFGSDRPYLSTAYLQFFREFVLEAKKRDMRVWIVDDAGYPSGFAGGEFTAEYPTLRMQALKATRTPLAAGAIFDEPVPPDTVAVTASSQDGQDVSIAFDKGSLHWVAPAGNWTVSVVQHVFQTSPTRSDTNLRRVKDGSQSLEDYLDPAATAKFIEVTHAAYKAVMGDEFGRTILGFRGDEPDYSISGLPWTPEFFSRFEQVKGYDVRPFLAALLAPKDVALTGQQQLVRADYYDVFSILFRDGFFKPLGDWCAANGLEYEVHLNHEEQQLALAHSEGDFFRDMRYVQVPGIDAIWHQIWTDTVSDFPRLASSAAHVYGHPRAFTESFAAYRPLPDVAMARYILNEQFVRGVNQVEAMYYPASSSPGHGGKMEWMKAPGFPALMLYTSRLSFVMSMGRPAAEVALLLPAESLWMGNKRADDTFVSTERLLSEHQIDFDIVDEDAINSVLTSASGAFLNESGNRYRTVLIPRADLLPASVVERLHEFSREGGKVIFLGKSPSLIASGDNREAHPARSDDFPWATILNEELPVTPTPPAQPPAAAPYPLVVPPALLAAVEEIAARSKLKLQAPQTALRVTTRKLKDASLFLLFNESAVTLNTELTLSDSGKYAEVWDADTGTTHAVHNQRSSPGGRIFVPLELPPYATEILVVR